MAALRSAVPGRMWGGKGCGAPCDFCRVLVAAQEVEYEVEARIGGESLILHFHPRCYDTWLTSLGSESREPPSRESAPAAK